MSMPLNGRGVNTLLTLILGSISKKLVLSDEEIAANFDFSLVNFIKDFIAKTGYFHLQGMLEFN